MTSRFILESFWQEGYNCATVAIIKTAIITYGIDHVFTAEYRDEEVFITLRNGRKMVLTPKEMERINRKNHFGFSRYADEKKKKDLRRLKDYVELCFAVMVKRLHERSSGKWKTVTKKQARHTLNYGFNVEKTLKLLGLQMNTKDAFDIKEDHLPGLKRSKAVVLYNDYHAVALAGGFWDDYGTARPLKDEIPEIGDDEEGEEAAYWFELEPPD